MAASQDVILAAGGILVRHDADGDKIAVVERARYPGEIGLPKGNVRPRRKDSPSGTTRNL
jgi:hypothetical protein